MIRLVFFFLTVILCSSQAFSQSAQDNAKAAYFQAEDRFRQQDFEGCLERLDEAVRLLGTSNARIQYLKTKAYYGSNDLKQARDEVEKYFAFQPKEDDWYREMLALSSEIDAKLMEKEAATAKAAEEERVWSLARKENSKEALEKYCLNYPQGKYVGDAMIELEKTQFQIAWNANTIDEWKVYLGKFPTENAQNIKIAQFNLTILEELKKARQNPSHYISSAFREYVGNDRRPDVNYIWEALKHGGEASVKAELKYANRVVYESPLTLGVSSKSKLGVNVVPYLRDCFERGADPNHELRYNYYDARDACSKDYVIEDFVESYYKDGPLFLDVMEVFIENGLDVNIDDGKILFKLVAKHSGQVNQIPVIELFLRSGADPLLTPGTVRCWVESASGSYYMNEKRVSAYKLAKEEDKYDLIEVFDRHLGK